MHNQSTILIKTIALKVQFSCRLFLQYTQNQRTHRTQSIKVDSKQKQYQLKQQIAISSDLQSTFGQDSYSGIRVTVKLLSSKGYQFNAGFFVIKVTDFNGYQSIVKYKISKSGEIDAQCICQLKKNFVTQNYGLNEIKEELQRSKPQTQQLYSPKQPSRAIEESKNILPEISVVKNKNYQTILSKPKVRTKTHQKSSKDRNEKERKDSFKYGSQSAGMQRHYESRYKDLQREIGFHGQLFQKQRQIITILENKYRQALNQQQKLKISLHRCQIELEQKRKRIMNLEEEKIDMMHSRVDNERKFYQFRESIRSMFEVALRQLNQIYLQKWLQRQLPSKIGEDSIKNSRVESKSPFKNLANQQSELAENDQFYNYHLIQQSEINQTSKKDVCKSLGGKKLRRKCQQLQFEECFNLISQYKDKILKKVSIKTNSISSKLAELGHTNNFFKLKLKQNTEEFQNNQQALFQYLQQLQEGLQTQLQITEQKQQAIFNYLSMIQQLTEKVTYYQHKISTLEEQNVRLEEEKQFIKSQLHQNNYIFSVRQEELMKKLHQLQQNAVLPFGNIRSVDSKIYTLNVFQEEEPKQTNQQSLVREYCQRMRSKQMELLFERKQKQKLMQQLENKEQELRYTMLNKKKLELAIKLKEKLSDASADNHKSFQIHEDQNNHYVEQQFLRILT